MEDASASMCIECFDQTQVLHKVSSESSVLPALSLPPVASYPHSPSLFSSPQNAPVSSAGSSSDLSNFSSASKLIPARSLFDPPFPPPLANATISEIRSVSSSSDSSVETVGSHPDTIIAARALVRLSRSHRLR